MRNDLSSYEDGQGVFRLPDKAAGIRYQARDAVKELSESYDEFDGYTPLQSLFFLGVHVKNRDNRRILSVYNGSKCRC